MGEHFVDRIKQKEKVDFIHHLLNDVLALDRMLEIGLIEDGVVRIGAEQEFCLVNSDWRPSKKAIQILKEIDEPHFTTELALYNLEINLDPLLLEKDCFQKMKAQLDGLLKRASEIANKHNDKVLLTGILPTISKNELHKTYMTPSPRYDALNSVMREFRGSEFSLHMKGVDELSVKHESVLFEACNTSFQLHLQIPPDDFIKSYNWAQAISGPVLAISQWAEGAATAVFKEDIALHEVALSKQIKTDAIIELKNGRIPKLEALKLHNGTIYRWNRPCYGICAGKPHLRIENRYIPSGPSVLDEIANFVFWVGLMTGRPLEYDDMPSQMDFRDAKANFIRAARTGKESILRWNHREYPVSNLIIEVLLPIAKKGLKKMKVDEQDISSFLEIIKFRALGTSGAQWQINNYRRLTKSMKNDDALVLLTKSIHRNQKAGRQINDWSEIKIDHSNSGTLVGHIMSTALYTVHKNDLSDLATSIMKWKKIHHMPVISRKGKLIGLLTSSYMEELQKTEKIKNRKKVGDIMIKKVYHVDPSTSIKEAVQLLEKHQIGCLPVVSAGVLVGIISKNDIAIQQYGSSI